MPNISIVVPVYKVEKYLNRCVDSILAQTYSDFDLILVDDGSPDNCGQICDEYAKKDARIHVIHRENGGLSAARNSGIDWVFDNHFTEWITFIDSDDWIHSEYLNVLLDCNITQETNISIGAYKESYDNSTYSDLRKNIRKLSPEEFWVENRSNSTVAWGKLYKTSLFESVRYPEGKLHEDELTTYKLLFSQEYISVSSDELYMYYQASSSIMRSEWTPKKLDSLEAFQEQLLFFKKNNYRKAYTESKKQYMFSVTHNLNEIKKSEDKKENYILMKHVIKKYLHSRYHSKLISSMWCCGLYIRKIRLELFFSVRVDVIKRRYRENGIKGIFVKS